MKKIAISLFALAAVSTAALANSNRSYDLRDWQSYNSTSGQATSVNTANEKAFAVGSTDRDDSLSLQYFIHRSQRDRNAE